MFLPQFQKEALIVDERFNNGGQIPARFIEMLNRPLLNYWSVRHGHEWQWPVKSHIGHLYGGSGVTSAISILGSINRGQAPGIRNLVNLLPEAVEVQDRALPIASTRPLPPGTRLGAVQSLGLGGANFVMIMEPGTVRTTLPPGPGGSTRRFTPGMSPS